MNMTKNSKQRAFFIEDKEYNREVVPEYYAI